MALTSYQLDILRRLAQRRKQQGVSYVAGGVALNKLLGASRVSRDIDLFHDTTEALAATWEADRRCLEDTGYSVRVVREASSYVEASVHSGTDDTLIEWLRDSAFRFFPLIEDEILGLTLHPFDLATNKILALAGRLEPRDWIDVLECHRSLQPLGYLAWAACGKDPGMNPDMIMADAARLHYAQPEIDSLEFDGTPPSCAELSREWKKAVASARAIVDSLPEEHLGECVLDAEGKLFAASADRLGDDLDADRIRFHKGSIGGAWPRIV